ncbi:MAG: hypothetical protein ABH879_09120 [archaeon]
MRYIALLIMVVLTVAFAHAQATVDVSVDDAIKEIDGMITGLAAKGAVAPRDVTPLGYEGAVADGDCRHDGIFVYNTDDYKTSTLFDEFLTEMGARDKKQIYIYTFASVDGEDTYNKELSKKRAKKVEDSIFAIDSTFSFDFTNPLGETTDFGLVSAVVSLTDSEKRDHPVLQKNRRYVISTKPLTIGQMRTTPPEDADKFINAIICDDNGTAVAAASDSALSNISPWWLLALLPLLLLLGAMRKKKKEARVEDRIKKYYHLLKVYHDKKVAMSEEMDRVFQRKGRDFGQLAGMPAGTAINTTTKAQQMHNQLEIRYKEIEKRLAHLPAELSRRTLEKLMDRSEFANAADLERFLQGWVQTGHLESVTAHILIKMREIFDAPPGTWPGNFRDRVKVCMKQLVAANPHVHDVHEALIEEDKLLRDVKELQNSVEDPLIKLCDEVEKEGQSFADKNFISPRKKSIQGIWANIQVQLKQLQGHTRNSNDQLTKMNRHIDQQVNRFKDPAYAEAHTPEIVSAYQQELTEYNGLKPHMRDEVYTLKQILEKMRDLVKELEKTTIGAEAALGANLDRVQQFMEVLQDKTPGSSNIFYSNLLERGVASGKIPAGGIDTYLNDIQADPNAQRDDGRRGPGPRLTRRQKQELGRMFRTTDLLMPVDQRFFLRIKEWMDKMKHAQAQASSEEKIHCAQEIRICCNKILIAIQNSKKQKGGLLDHPDVQGEARPRLDEIEKTCQAAKSMSDIQICDGVLGRPRP